MALGTEIRDALLADTSIAYEVGRRIRPLGVSPADARPYLTYQVTGRESLGTLSDGPADYRKAGFEVGVFADTYADVMALSDLVRDRLDRLDRLDQFGQTVSGVEFAPCEFDSETDVEEAVPEGEEKPVYLRVQTYRTLYRITA